MYLEQPIKYSHCYDCVFCGDKFKSKVELSNHVRRKHSQDQVSQTDQPKTEKDIFPKYPCFYCEKEMSSVEILHVQYHECRDIGIIYEDMVENVEFDEKEVFPSLVEPSTYDMFFCGFLKREIKSCHMLMAQPSTYDNFQTCCMLTAEPSTYD